MDASRAILLIAFISTLLTNTLCVPSKFGAPAPSPVSMEFEAAATTTTFTSSSSGLSSPANGLGVLTSLVGSAFGEPSVKLDPALLKICSVTENPTLCADTILPTIQGAVTPHAALNTEIEACMNKTTEVMNSISTILANSASASHTEKSALETCKNNYDDVIDSLKSAKEAIIGYDVGTLKSMLSAVISDIVTCDDSFSEFPDITSPLDKEMTESVYKLAGNCLDMIQLIN